MFVFSWDHCKSQEKLETMLMQNLGRQTKNYGIWVDKQKILWYYPKWRFEVVNCLVVFSTHLNPNNFLWIILQISLLFTCTPALILLPKRTVQCPLSVLDPTRTTRSRIKCTVTSGSRCFPYFELTLYWFCWNHLGGTRRGREGGKTKWKRVCAGNKGWNEERNVRILKSEARGARQAF